MYAQRRVRDLPAGPDDALRRNLIRCARIIAGSDEDRLPAIRSAIEKDTHLLEAAVMTGGHVASLDDKVRGHFTVCARTNRRLRNTCWVNPTNPDEDAVGWVCAGTPPDSFRALGYAASPD